MTAARRVLVTGASGFIGRFTVPLLRAHGFEVHAIGRSAGNLLSPGVPASIIDHVRPTHLLHLAWNARPGEFWNAPDNLDWVGASLSLFRAFSAAGGARAVFAGTCAEYDWSYRLLDEITTPCAPTLLYGIAKDSVRRLLEASPEAVSIAWGRVFFLYGPHEPPGRLIPDVIRCLLEGQDALCGNGLVERDYMHVADAAAALVALLESDVAGPVNIASGHCLTLRDVIGRIAGQIGRPDLIRFGARSAPISEPPRMEAAIDRLRHEVGFSPSRTLDEGIADTIAWWRGR